MNGERERSVVAGFAASGPAPGESAAIAATATRFRRGSARSGSERTDEPEPVRLVDRVLRLPDRPAPRAPGTDRVGALLARLTRKGSRWHDVLGVPVGADGAPVEHLLIGPGGIYTLGAKYHPNARVRVRGNFFRVDGEPYAYVSESRHEALRASRALTAACGFPVSVAGVVVVVGVEDIVVREVPRGVHVLSGPQLRSWFRRQGEVLDGPTIAAVHDAARTSSAWVSPH